MNQITYTFMDSFIGKILIAQDIKGLREIRFVEGEKYLPPDIDWLHIENLRTEAVDQLHAYFNGKQHAFNLPLSMAGTAK